MVLAPDQVTIFAGKAGARNSLAMAVELIEFQNKWSDGQSTDSGPLVDAVDPIVSRLAGSITPITAISAVNSTRIRARTR